MSTRPQTLNVLQQASTPHGGGEAGPWAEGVYSVCCGNASATSECVRALRPTGVVRADHSNSDKRQRAPHQPHPVWETEKHGQMCEARECVRLVTALNISYQLYCLLQTFHEDCAAIAPHNQNACNEFSVHAPTPFNNTVLTVVAYPHMPFFSEQHVALATLITAQYERAQAPACDVQVFGPSHREQASISSSRLVRTANDMYIDGRAVDSMHTLMLRWYECVRVRVYIQGAGAGLWCLH